VLDGTRHANHEHKRAMLDDHEWAWLEDQCAGDVEHLIIASSLPVLMLPGLHDLEAWNEKVCDGAWGSLAARAAEKLRRGLDLEHWAAFEDSFHRMARLLEDVAAGRVAHKAEATPDALEELLVERDVRAVIYSGWLAIDELERAAGEKLGRPRVKLHTWDELLAAAERVAETA
jgi:hypothetical protein